jgi:hypothetical protein
MGRYSGSRLHDVTPEEQLMQRAGDPLLVREFLSRQSTLEPVPGVAPPMSGEATIRLARCILAQGSVEHLSVGQASRRYGARDPLLENSQVPSAFIPSEQDREGVMELGQPQPGKETPAVAGPVAVIMAMAVAAVLLWM